MTKKNEDPKAHIMGTYTKLAEQRRVHPTTSALVRLGITRNMIRHHFGSLTLLHAAASLKGKDAPPIPKELENELIVTQDLALNRSLFVSSIKLSAKHIDPITGLSRIGQRNGSFVYASPKQRLKLIATSNTALPGALMTTGAITLPDYEPNPDWSHAYMSKRTAYIADNDHVMGAIIVEIASKTRFHYRQIQADSAGRFADLGKLYSREGAEDFAPEALVLGDWHSATNDPVARRIFVEGAKSVASTLQPRIIIVHDGFDGQSINHHEEKNQILRARLANQKLLNLRDEVQRYAADLEMMTHYCEEVVVVKSNHDEFLDRYLAEGRYHNDHQNFEAAVQMAGWAVQGLDPLETLVRSFLSAEASASIRFLKRDEDLKIGGIECGAHGDKGANGSRGSLASMEKAYGAYVGGHVHTPEILRRCISVGTCSYLKQGYNVGPSSWLQSSCCIYGNGAFQLHNCIDGEWRT